MLVRELLKKHQDLKDKEQDFAGALQGLRGDSSRGTWRDGLDKDRRPSVRILADHLEKIRSEIQELEDLEVLPAGKVAPQ